MKRLADEVLINAIGVMKTMNDCYGELTEPLDIVRYKFLQELKEYREIGTVEECREAVEKQKPEKPDYEGDGYDNNGNIIYDTWICPTCGAWYEVDYDDYKHCPECGQAIDLSGEV